MAIHEHPLKDLQGISVKKGSEIFRGSDNQRGKKY